MLGLVTGPIAGPSRLRSLARGIHYSATIQAAAKRRPILSTPPPRAPPAAPTRQPSIRPSTKSQLLEIPSNAERTRTPPLASTWAWRPIENPLKADVIEEERTVFARPFELGRPRMYWFGIVISGLFFTTWIIFPPPARNLPPVEGQVEFRESPRDTFIHYASATAVAIVAVVSIGLLAIPSRCITRLSLIRSRPASGAGDTRVFWRLRHAGHDMFSETSRRSRPRDLAIHDLNVRMLRTVGDRAPYLSLTVTKPKSTSVYLSLDSWPYRMDYRDTELTKKTEEEVVLSLNRIEHIFGRLDPDGKPLKAVLVDGE